MLRWIAAALGGVLVLFHGWLLASQFWDGQLAEPGLAFRWVLAAAIGAALGELHKRGGRLFWGRKAVAVWLLAVLLHAPALADGRSAFESPALPEAVATVLQIATAAGVLGVGLMLAGVVRRLRSPGSRRRLRPASATRSRRRAPDAPPRFAPRPPPALPHLA